MSTFERIMIALDLTDMDRSILEYMNVWTKITKPRKIYFIHIEPSLDVPHFVTPMTEPEEIVGKPEDELIREALEKEIEQYFGKHEGIETENVIIEGSPAFELLHWAEIKKVDLIVVGRKDISRGSGIIPRRLVRKANGSVLFIPEDAPADFSKILVPIDFSESSGFSLLKTRELARKFGTGKLICQNVYFIPPTLNLRISRTPEQFNEIMRENVESTFGDFLKKNKIPQKDVELVLTRNENNNPAKEILRYARKNAVNLIAIGAKGHSKFDLLLIGSVTERLLTYNYLIPTLVIKKREIKMWV